MARGRVGGRIKASNYVHKQSNGGKNDKYAGLLSRRQLADLEGETELDSTMFEKDTLEQRNARMEAQRTAGISSLMHDPYNPTDGY